MNAELHPAIHQWKHHTLSLSAKIFNQSFSCLAGSIHRVSHLTPSPGPCSSASHSKDGEHRRLHHRVFRNTLSKPPVLYIGLCMLNLRAENNWHHSPVFLGLWEACKHLGIHYLNIKCVGRTRIGIAIHGSGVLHQACCSQLAILVIYLHLQGFLV